jgi:hypothetical protein
MTYRQQSDGELAQPVLRAAFETLAPELTGFAERHSLRIERYKRGFPIWAFSFRHPKGGAASIQFGLTTALESGQVGATVQPHWWVDFEAERRRLAASFLALRLVSLDEVEVSEALEFELAKVLASEESALTRESRLVDPALTAVRGPEYGPPDVGKLPWPT